MITYHGPRKSNHGERCVKNAEIFDLVKSTIVKVIPKFANRNIKPSDSLKKLGVNSIERMEITMLIMEELEIDIPRTELLGPKNLAEFLALLESKLDK